MNEEQRLDSLLNAIPLEPLPAGLAARIMVQIRPMPTFAPFRLQPSDILLALACTVFMIAGLSFAIIPLLQDVQPAIDFSQFSMLIDPKNLTLPLLLLLELLLGYAIYLSLMEE